MYVELMERVNAEQKAYREYLLTLSPDEIIRKAYEICWREEIVIALQCKIQADEVIVNLLKLPNIIDTLYDEWLKTDTSINEELVYVIEDIAEWR